MASSTTQERALKTYTKKESTMFYVGLAGQNIFYNIIGTALTYYLQFTILIPAFTVSVIMAIARVWDAVNDPMMGTIVDKTRTKWGKCRPYLLFVPLPIMIITILCFTNFGFYDPSASAWSAHNVLIVAYAAVTYILWGMTYTVGDIPLWGVTALMTEKDDDRNKLLSFARIWASVGAGITLLTVNSVALKLGGIFAQSGGRTPAQGERLGFIASAVIFSVVGYVLYQMAGIFVRERVPASSETRTMKENFALMWKNKPFRQILLSGVLGSPKSTIALAAMSLVTYYYASKDPLKAMLYILLLGGALFIGQFLSMGIAPKLVKKYEKKTLYNWSNIIGVIPYGALYLLYNVAPNHDLTTVFFLIVCAVLFFGGGFAMGITNVLQSLMIADAVDYEEYCSGIRPDGVFFSGQTFIAKITSAIATIINGIAYSVVGFSDAKVAEVNEFINNGGIPRLNPEYQPFMSVLFFVCSIPPVIGCLMAVIPTWKYALSDKEHKRILDELNSRRHADSAE
ncbi:MAG: MFS transporter [Acutalibacteraceae bacterium]